jgi:hypothetical protein
MVSMRVWPVSHQPCCGPCWQGLPLGVEDGCRGSLGCDLVEAIGLLVGALIAESAEPFLVVAPCHVVLAPMPGTSLDLFLAKFSLLGRCLLPVFISLLFLLVSDVLLVLMFLVICSTFPLASCFIVILGSRGLLQVGCQLELPLRAVSSACIAMILSLSGDLAPHVPSCFNRLNLLVANMISSLCMRVSVPSV